MDKKHTNRIIRTALDMVKPQFRLPIDHGYHGIKHWVRVWANAEMLCTAYGVDPTVSCWFAFLHDSQRCNEDRDPQHGLRAAQFAWDRRKTMQLSPKQANSLYYAMVKHSDGLLVAADLQVRICWDADRLDLGRVGIMPDPKRLATTVARRPEVIAAAYERSIK